jgi:hypothetical protein
MSGSPSELRTPCATEASERLRLAPRLCTVDFVVVTPIDRENIQPMPVTDPVTLIAPLSLSNVLTVLCALVCLWTASPQAGGGIWRLWRLAVPGAFAVVVSLMLLAGVFQATWEHDAEWLAGLLLGGLVGRARGWTLPVKIDQMRGLVRLPRAKDGVLASLGVVAMAALDFVGAALDEAVLAPQFVAAGSALFASFLACRGLAIIVRSTRAPHVRLHDAA